MNTHYTHTHTHIRVFVHTFKQPCTCLQLRGQRQSVRSRRRQFIACIEFSLYELFSFWASEYLRYPTAVSCGLILLGLEWITLIIYLYKHYIRIQLTRHKLITVITLLFPIYVHGRCHGNVSITRSTQWQHSSCQRICENCDSIEVTSVWSIEWQLIETSYTQQQQKNEKRPIMLSSRTPRPTVELWRTAGEVAYESGSVDLRWTNVNQTEMFVTWK